MLSKVSVLFQYLLPKQFLTQLAGFLADKQLGIVTTWFIKLFVKCYRVDLEEAEKQTANQYQTFNAFFSRRLAEGKRPIIEDESVLTFPADGVMSQFGHIEGEQLIQAKGHYYSLDALLACDKQLVEIFKDGLFATTYLSPRDYHRIHMPCNAILREVIYVPGSLFSVNKNTTENIANIFARNERAICVFDTDFGPMVQILVGATIVGSIELSWFGKVCPPREGIMKRWSYPKEGDGVIMLSKGDELGCFNLGSTVITLFSKTKVAFSSQIQEGFITRVGAEFATKL